MLVREAEETSLTMKLYGSSSASALSGGVEPFLPRMTEIPLPRSIVLMATGAEGWGLTVVYIS